MHVQGHLAATLHRAACASQQGAEVIDFEQNGSTVLMHHDYLAATGC